ncbi:Uncharacterized protein TPAR_07334 [Tolypocladium paradoxum]|uniref:DNA-directed RNA polymerase II subunit RPB9-like zinc ribbon domain-containing protein n=1 Tax=Tolypocladium paradoxum TaxID=94208 RepID=A0A2S4KQI5_9HYPO|nr:Uncharacterized protein TPAR_07334 [Tolypocladium paradoxum]
MATPQSTTSQEDASGDKKLEQITFRFCSECSNMLYPKEDEDAHKLQFTCRTCQYTEEATSTCVFRNVLNNSAGETAGVTQDVGSDPTVSEVLPVFCLTCGTVISCELCPYPAVFLAAFKREKKQEGNMGMAHFILGLNENNSDDPFAEYDEEPQNDEDRLTGGDSGYATIDSNHSAGEASDANGGSADEDDTTHSSDESRRASAGQAAGLRDVMAMVVRF